MHKGPASSPMSIQHALGETTLTALLPELDSLAGEAMATYMENVAARIAQP